MINNEQPLAIQNKDENNEKKELETNNIEGQNIKNSFPENIQNINQFQNMKNTNEKEKELEDQDGTDNLRYISNNNHNNNNNNINFYIQQRLDSCDSAAQYKFSIDLPNVPKQRLHEYLNDDLLNELDYNSPNIPNLNSGISNNNKLSISNETNDNNNPNNLFDFSLYPQLNDNNDGNKNNQNYINKNINQNMNYNIQDYNIGNNFNNMNNNNNYSNAFYYNNFQNFNYMNNNMNNLNYNMNSPQVYIPTKLRNKEDKKELIHGQKNQQNINKKEELQNNAKNKFDNNKKNGQNLKKEKNKKHFEIRAGDWTCNKCNNLNFSFRNKCNRCGLPKELNKKIEPMNPEVFGQNPNYQLINGINTNIFYGNANVNNINNMNNSNDIKFYPK